jgi:hypothetical protein
MKTKIYFVAGAFILSLAAGAISATYYVNDTSTAGDVYCTNPGHNANDGLTPATPISGLNGLMAKHSLQPGDLIYIDTGTYDENVVIGTNVAGSADNPIVFQGSTSTQPWGDGTTFTEAGTIMEVRGKHLVFRDIRTMGGSWGVSLLGASYCQFENIYAVSNRDLSIRLSESANSNQFRRCVLWCQNYSAFNAGGGSMGNYLEHCISYSANASAFAAQSGVVSNIVGCIALGKQGIAGASSTPDGGTRNIFFNTERVHGDYETLADLQRINTNWYGNAVGDPMFVNAEGMDFHLLSASGFISNGVWVTNAAVGYSPAIDFGPRE